MNDQHCQMTMSKLDDIPKKNVFKVPDGYFEKLPGIIQSRVTKEPAENNFIFWSRSFRLTASAALVLVVAGLFWLNHDGNQSSTENLLATVETSELISYLNEYEISTDELLEDFSFDSEDVSSIEASAYRFEIGDTDIEQLLDDIEQ